jgi:hypothetical protein
MSTAMRTDTLGTKAKLRMGRHVLEIQLSRDIAENLSFSAAPRLC